MTARTLMAAGNLRPLSAISVQPYHVAQTTAKGTNAQTRIALAAPATAPKLSIKTVAARALALPGAGRFG
jgi:hypothetical protein